MKILLLGGTGAMGVHLKDVLTEQGNDVYITTRKIRKNGNRVFYLIGDAHDMYFLQKVLSNGWDAIVDFMVYSTEEFKERVKYFLDSTRQYVFISSARVFANVELPIKENTPRLLDISKDVSFLSTDEYSLRKAREEDILTNGKRDNYVIIRPYITYSEKRLQLGDLELPYWLPRALDGRCIVFSEDIKDHITTLTYGLDVAKGIAALIGNSKANGEVFNIVSDKSLRWTDVLNIYFDAIEQYKGFRPKVKWIKKSYKLNNDATKYQIIYDRTFDRSFDNSKICSIAPSLSFVDPREGLTKCIKSFINSDESVQFSGIREGVRDRITGEKIQLSKLKSTKDKMLYIMYRYFYFDRW